MCVYLFMSGLSFHVTYIDMAAWLSAGSCQCELVIGVAWCCCILAATGSTSTAGFVAAAISVLEAAAAALLRFLQLMLMLLLALLLLLPSLLLLLFGLSCTLTRSTLRTMTLRMRRYVRC